MRYARKQRLLSFLTGYISVHGEGPLFREIAEYFQVRSMSSVHLMLKSLESEGLIRRTRKWRGIEVVK